MIFRRSRARRGEPQLAEDQLRASWQLVSLLMEYPTAQLQERIPALRAVLPELPASVGEPLSRLTAYLADTPVRELQSAYVDTFDVTRRCCLYLTYFAHGDTRTRGVALVQIKQAFRRAGVEYDAEELPDHLCVVLEFGASVDRGVAWKLLNDHRAGLEMVRIALQDKASPWADGLVALSATLPELQGEDRDAVARLVAEGPPSEDVGIETYAIDPLLSDTRLNPRPSEPVDLGRTIAVGVQS